VNNQIHKYDYLLKIDYCSTCVFFIHVQCFLMYTLLYFSFIWLHVYAFAINIMVNCGSAFEPGASGLPYYCTSTCVRSWCNWRASCVDSKPNQKKMAYHALVLSTSYPGPPTMSMSVELAKPGNTEKSYTKYHTPLVTAEWIRQLTDSHPSLPSHATPTGRTQAHRMMHEPSLHNNRWNLETFLSHDLGSGIEPGASSLENKY